MKIELTREQYLDLLIISHIASDVLEILGDLSLETDYKKKSDELESLREYIISHTKDFDYDNLTENFQGKTLMTDDFYEKIEEIMEEYNDYIFWSELETRMGKRDFERTITEEDRKQIRENQGWLPERIQELYNKYGEELEEYGIDRLEIKE